MQVKGYLTLTEVAKLCGCKPQNISKKINKYKDYYKPYVTRHNRRIYIKKEAVELLKNNNHNNRNNGCEVASGCQTGCDSRSRAVADGCKEVANLEREIKELREQLNKRNERIDELTDELLKINRTVAPLIAFYGKGVPSVQTNLIESKTEEKLTLKDKIKLLFS